MNLLNKYSVSTESNYEYNEKEITTALEELEEHVNEINELNNDVTRLETAANTIEEQNLVVNGMRQTAENGELPETTQDALRLARRAVISSLGIDPESEEGQEMTEEIVNPISTESEDSEKKGLFKKIIDGLRKLGKTIMEKIAVIGTWLKEKFSNAFGYYQKMIEDRKRKVAEILEIAKEKDLMTHLSNLRSELLQCKYIAFKDNTLVYPHDLGWVSGQAISVLKSIEKNLDKVIDKAFDVEDSEIEINGETTVTLGKVFVKQPIWDLPDVFETLFYNQSYDNRKILVDVVRKEFEERVDRQAYLYTIDLYTKTTKNFNNIVEEYTSTAEKDYSRLTDAAKGKIQKVFRYYIRLASKVGQAHAMACRALLDNRKSVAKLFEVIEKYQVETEKQ